MNLLQLILLGIEAVSALASNPVFGLKEDGLRLSALLALLAKFGRKGDEARAELKAFTAEINAIIAAGARVDPSVWDALTAKRHADLDRIRDSGSGGGTG